MFVPVPASDQCKHFYMVLQFPYGPCTGRDPIPVQCEYIDLQLEISLRSDRPKLVELK